MDAAVETHVRRLRRELAGLEEPTRAALARALDRDEVRLRGTRWGSHDDGEGCLLSLAAWEMGEPDGSALMIESISAVRLPAVFDALWAVLLVEVGDAVGAELVARSLVRTALADIEAATRDLASQVPSRS